MSEQNELKSVNQLRHDARRPLVLMIGTLELLLSGVEGELSSQVRADLEAVYKNAKQALSAVDALIKVQGQSE